MGLRHFQRHKSKIVEPAHKSLVHNTFATKRGSDEPSHSGSLIRAFPTSKHKVQR